MEKLIIGKDNHFFGAMLRLLSKNGHTTILQWPLQLLYPLEVTSKESSPLPNERHAQDKDHVEVYEQNESKNSSNVGDTLRPNFLIIRKDK